MGSWHFEHLQFSGGGQVPTRGGATQIYSIQINFHLQQIVKSNMLSYSSIIFEFVGAFK